MYKANQKRDPKEKINYTLFYNEAINTQIDIVYHYEEWA